MATFQLKLPIQTATEYGFKHIKTVEASVWQDLRSLLLTIPGEKINDSEFGVGIQTYLFEQNSELLRQELDLRIREKVAKYLPFLVIEEILFTDQDNLLLLTVKYYVGNNNNLDEVVLKLNTE